MPGLNGPVYALTAFDDGGGPALYVGGGFDTAGGIPGGIPASDIAKWDGTSWSALGSGVVSGVSGVDALTVFDDGSGPALYAGGSFTSAGGLAAAKSIAKWDGMSWSALSGGVSQGVDALTVFDDKSGVGDVRPRSALLRRPNALAQVRKQRSALGCLGNPASLTALVPKLGPPSRSSTTAAARRSS